MNGLTTSTRACSRTGLSFWATAINDEVANLIIAQLLFLESEDPEKDINFYINSPGGIVTAGLAVYDTMQYIKPDIATVCLGQAASMGAVLLAAGAQGQALRAAQLAHPDSPASGRLSGSGGRHRHPGQGDPAHPRQSQPDFGEPYPTGSGADREGYRPGFFYVRGGGQGLRDCRSRDGQPR